VICATLRLSGGIREQTKNANKRKSPASAAGLSEFNVQDFRV